MIIPMMWIGLKAWNLF